WQHASTGSSLSSLLPLPANRRPAGRTVPIGRASSNSRRAPKSEEDTGHGELSGGKRYQSPAQGLCNVILQSIFRRPRFRRFLLPEESTVIGPTGASREAGCSISSATSSWSSFWVAGADVVNTDYKPLTSDVNSISIRLTD